MKYTGERNGKGQPHGQGTETCADGSTYIGEFWNCRLESLAWVRMLVVVIGVQVMLRRQKRAN